MSKDKIAKSPPPKVMRAAQHEAMEQMKGQLIICLVRKLGGKVTIPEAELNDTGGLMLTMDVNHVTREFTFINHKKH